MEQPKKKIYGKEDVEKRKSKTFVHYKNKYITYIKHKQNCIVPYTEIKPTTTKSADLLS